MIISHLVYTEVLQISGRAAATALISSLTAASVAKFPYVRVTPPTTTRYRGGFVMRGTMKCLYCNGLIGDDAP